MISPERWIKAKLADLGDWHGGTTPSKSNPAYWTSGTIPWVSPKVMKRAVIAGSEEAITQTAIDHGAATIIPPGSVLIVVRSGILQHSVPVAVTSVACAINQDLRALVPAEGVDAFFVAAQLRWRASDILTVARKVGVTVDSLDQKRLMLFQIDLAPTSEQVRISSRLGELEEYIAAADAALDVTPGAVQSLRDNAAGRLLLPRKGVRSSDASADLSVKDLAVERVRTGLSIRGAAEPPGVPSLRLSALSRPQVDMSDTRYLPVGPETVANLVLQNGDVLVSRGSGTRAFVGRASMVTNADGHTIFPDTAFRIRLNTKIVLPAWFLAAWNSLAVRERLHQRARTTAGIWKIPLSQVLTTTLPIPPINEQKADLQRLDVIGQQLERVERKLERARRLLERTRAAIYTRAFGGILVDPTDDAEDASLLLERLMAIRDTPKARRPRRQKPPTTAQRLDELFKEWPKTGGTFEDLRKQLLAPYEEIKDAVFERLARGELRQRFDADAGQMLLLVSPK